MLLSSRLFVCLRSCVYTHLTHLCLVSFWRGVDKSIYLFVGQRNKIYTFWWGIDKMTLIYCRNGNGSGIWSSIHLSVRLCTSPGPDDLSIQLIPCMARSLAMWTAPDITLDLSFSQHINRFTVNASKSLGFLKRNILTQNPAIRKAAYTTIVHPQVEYSCLVSSPYTKKI